MRRLLLAAIAALALAAPAPAGAYLNVDNAYAACGVESEPGANAWFAANGYGSSSWWTHPTRYTRTDTANVQVPVSHWSGVFPYSTGGRMNAYCYVSGSNSNLSVWFYWTYYGPYYAGRGESEDEVLGGGDGVDEVDIPTTP